MAEAVVKLSPGTEFLFRQMEKKERQNEEARRLHHESTQDVELDLVEGFFRQIKTQNIFIQTVGINGKAESTILSKAIFSMNKVVKVYYSTSFDEDNTGFIRVRSDNQLQQIVIERMHGYRPQPEVLYQSADQCHIIRWMIKWLMPRIDWRKTKLGNLDLYRLFSEKREKDALQKKLEEAEVEG
ncbi:hypothetical protein [Thiomicrorhabdus sp. 6S3-12]|uniref:hypothetical protein n=1 Tax=Thiomicrorhabdus sp. 6S3-12 TaxID=2819681 RepID=UPI001AAC6403|nr:hypothetical protein [Thiomicrorhabdus sp. 6S3-12]MBO1923945.1 hypothetical protein [Thiomicrorhabdus sp. 6S3-12]